MLAYYLALFFGVAIPLGVWATSRVLSLDDPQLAMGKKGAVVAVLLSCIGMLGVFAASAVDDFNDYPGYTCTLRDSPELTELRAEWHQSPDVADLPEPSSFHNYELFPLGMECTHNVPGSPGLTVTTHSHWSYTLFFYALATIAVVQTIRVLCGGSGTLPARQKKPTKST